MALMGGSGDGRTCVRGASPVLSRTGSSTLTTLSMVRSEPYASIRAVSSTRAPSLVSPWTRPSTCSALRTQWCRHLFQHWAGAWPSTKPAQPSLCKRTSECGDRRRHRGAWRVAEVLRQGLRALGGHHQSLGRCVDVGLLQHQAVSAPHGLLRSRQRHTCTWWSSTHRRPKHTTRTLTAYTQHLEGLKRVARESGGHRLSGGHGCALQDKRLPGRRVVDGLCLHKRQGLDNCAGGVGGVAVEQGLDGLGCRRRLRQ